MLAVARGAAVGSAAFVADREESSFSVRPVVYCLIPRQLAPKLHEVLRAYYQRDPSVRVVIEFRGCERRTGGDRRGAAAGVVDDEQRRIRAVAGRRAGERRATLVPVDGPELPRRARPFADQIVFAERLEPAGQVAEDVDTARLVAQIQAGDRDAFERLYVRYFDRVYSYLRLGLNDPHEAADAAQQVFVRVLDALPRYERRESVPFRAWLFAIARNHMRSELMRRGRIELVDDPAAVVREEEHGEQTAENLALAWITDQDLLLFIERLPLSQRQVLVLRFLLDLSHEQTAAVLGRSVEDVRRLQWRALQFLRARLTAVGRVPRRSRAPMMRARRKARVLRTRRFALSP
jgi:RNA polymerase sigma-70 factor (ECF subfamily)